MWNRDEIALKLKVVNDRIKSGNYDRQLLIQCDFYYRLLENSGDFNHGKISNLLHKLDLYKYTSNYKSHMDFNAIIEDYVVLANDELLNLLDTICCKVSFDAFKYYKAGVKYNKLNLSLEKKFGIIKDFYGCVDNTFGILAEDFLSERNLLNFSSCLSYENRKCAGNTFYDTEGFNSYIAIKKTDTILELQTLEHELMHAIDYMFKPKTYENHCIKYYDIVPFTMDLLFIDYLLENNFYSDEAKKLLMVKIGSIINVGEDGGLDYKLRLLCLYLAHYLYEEYKENKKVDNMVKLMKSRILTNDILKFFEGDNPMFDKGKVLELKPYVDYYNRWSGKK